MEATLNNGQFRPGNETPFMYTAFASEGEMLGFYLSLNRFVNPVTVFRERIWSGWIIYFIRLENFSSLWAVLVPISL